MSSGYTEIGSFDAKAHLSKLLQAVKKGQRFTITLRGEPIADLVPYEGAVKPNASIAIEEMRHFQKIQGVSDAMLTEWIAEGRR